MSKRLGRPKQKGPGRPRLPPDDARNVLFAIRLSRDERSRIEEAAYELGASSASDWARTVLLAAARD